MPWEEGVETAHERMKAKYADLVTARRESGWNVKLCPVEVGVRGFVGDSMTRLLQDLSQTAQGNQEGIGGDRESKLLALAEKA